MSCGPTVPRYFMAIISASCMFSSNVVSELAILLGYAAAVSRVELLFGTGPTILGTGSKEISVL